MKILFVIPSLDYGGAARQLTLIAEGLPRDRFRRASASSAATPRGPRSCARPGVEVDVLGWKRPFEPAPFLALRRRLAELRPDVVHLWGPAALRAAAALAGARRAGRLFVSAALPPRPAHGLARPLAAAPGRRRRRLRRGRGRPLPPPRRPAASASPSSPPACGRALTPTPSPPRGEGSKNDTPLPSGERGGVRGWTCPPAGCCSPPGRSKRTRASATPSGPSTFCTTYTRICGWCWPATAPTGRAWRRSPAPSARPTASPSSAGGPTWRRGVHAAELAWVPSRAGGGVNAALEAMAAGKPVVATRLPALAEIVTDGEVGCLVPPGDKTELARQTRFLLNDADRRRAYGEAGRRRAAEHFSVERLVRRCAELYEGRA